MVVIVCTSCVPLHLGCLQSCCQVEILDRLPAVVALRPALPLHQVLPLAIVVAAVQDVLHDVVLVVNLLVVWPQLQLADMELVEAAAVQICSRARNDAEDSTYSLLLRANFAC